MSSIRLKSSLWVKAIIRQFNQESAQAVLIKKGDDDAGTIFIILIDNASNYAIIREQGDTWLRVPLKNDPNIPPFQQIENYIEKQKKIDPDLWIIEINVVNCHSPIEKHLSSRYISDETP